MAVIDVAQNDCGLDSANSTDIEVDRPHPVIDLMPGYRGVEMGGSMRLGLRPWDLQQGTIVAQCDGEPLVYERHRDRFKVNNDYLAQLAGAGLIAGGESPDGPLVEIMELVDHRFFVGVQFHPEFRSRPERPHPLFKGFVGAAMNTVRDGVQ